MRCLYCGHTELPANTVDCPNCNVHLPHLMRDCLPSGTLLQNAYRIEYPLGRGGFGITYFARDTHLNDRPVAIKEFYPHEHVIREQVTGRLVVPRSKQDSYQRSLQRFLQEGATLAKLAERRNPGLVNVYASFQCRDTAFLVMEFIDGMTLRDKLNQQTNGLLPANQVKAIVSSLVEALSVAHEQKIYHLDISPDNIMVTPDNRIVLIDFGASRQGLGTSTTQAFKEAYAPLEVINGDGFGPWSDIFELGMMLHEMLTGSLPPKAISRIARGVDTWDPNLPEPWHQLILNATRLYKEDRPQSVEEWWHGKKDLPNPTVINPLIAPDALKDEPKTSFQPAGFALRSMANLIDWTLLIIASVIFHQVQGLTADSADVYIPQIFGIYMVLALVYCPVMESSPTQGTLGKMAAGIAVTDLRGHKIELGRAYNRHICKIFSYLTLLVGFFLAGFSEKKQALHDRITKCLVIKRVQHGYTASRDAK